MKTSFVTGGAGFIGGNLCARLLDAGHKVICYDNFSTGQVRFVEPLEENPNFKLLRGDLLDPEFLTYSLRGADIVWHLSANADVRFGLEHPRKDLEQNTIATHNVLEAMRMSDVREILFSSTGSVYGEASVIPTPEDAPFPVQTSLYAASKLACEGLVSAYCEGYGFRGVVCRFVSILGEGYTHGHVFDFVSQLRDNPEKLRVLGDGYQKKSYLYVQDCIDAMLFAESRPPEKYCVYNIGVDSYCTVRDSIEWITEWLGVKPEVCYTGGERGWVGDNPFIFLETRKIRSLGWEHRLSIKQAVERTVEFLTRNEWVFGTRRGI
ncbi:MAG: NAD-dependent epimerase/dehydratase family protein [Synergistaceae bacterium]|jgi:UDP-glucose 4-epimerase|nr:NAD-dependent epimerase/dehydratase family protein [Synergistaceae bacterium]